MISVAWRLQEIDYCYRIQFDQVHFKTEGHLFKILENWSLCGEVWNDDNTKSYIFQKSFESENEWVKWLNNFSYPVFEINRSSKLKRKNFKGKVEIVKKVEKPVKRVVATKNNKQQKSTRKQYVCKVCHKVGHNSRTCPMNSKQ